VHHQRPDKLNALNGDVLRELLDFNLQLRANRDVRGLILTGAGEKAFIAGADIAFMSGLDVRGAREFAELGHRVCDSFSELPFPVIAAVNGSRSAAARRWRSRATSSTPPRRRASPARGEARRHPGFGRHPAPGAARGARHAKEIIFGGEMIGAEEA